MVLEIFLKLLYCTMCEKKIQIYGVHIPSKSTESSNFYLCPSPLKTPPNSCDLPYRQKRIIHPPRKHPFENLFPTQQKGVEKNYGLICQNSVRKYESDLKHHAFFIFCMIYNFFKCDGFTVLQIKSII